MVDAADGAAWAGLERAIFLWAAAQPGAALSNRGSGKDDGLDYVRPADRRERELGFDGGVGAHAIACRRRDSEQLSFRVDAALCCEKLCVDADRKCRPDDRVVAGREST